jgi:hypothetical protein
MRVISVTRTSFTAFAVFRVFERAVESKARGPLGSV